MTFAKLRDDPAFGQVLFLLDCTEKTPVIKVFFQPEGLGLCHLLLKHEESDQGAEEAHANFETIDLEDVRPMLEAAFSQAHSLQGVSGTTH